MSLECFFIAQTCPRVLGTVRNGRVPRELGPGDKSATPCVRTFLMGQQSNKIHPTMVGKPVKPVAKLIQTLAQKRAEPGIGLRRAPFLMGFGAGRR